MNHIDRNVRKLVKILNKYPGVETVSSCGGHKLPTSCQVPENEWEITFDIFGVNKEVDLPSPDGWKSLGKISHATFEYLEINNGKIDLLVCNLSDRETDPEGLCNYFALHGYDSDIEKFCNILRRHIP
jgi:hypothetical protein